MIVEKTKFKIDDVYTVLEKLRNIGATHTGNTFEKIYRFDTPNLDYEKSGKFIRLKSGFDNVLTYKELVDNLDLEINDKINVRNEINIEVEDFENMEFILYSLGLTYKRIMEKYRFEWFLNDYSLTIDELPFGIYLEVNGGEAEISNLCNNLGMNFSNGTNLTYWEIYSEISDEKDIVFPPNYEIKLI
jgi:adenylate cyclase class 2